MRWLFLLLVVLNIFFYVWRQQEAPVRGKVVLPLSVYSNDQQGIRLLSEARSTQMPVGDDHPRYAECLSLLGVSGEEQLQNIKRRLAELDIDAAPASGDVSGYVLHLASERETKLSADLLQSLSSAFSGLHFKKIPCEGLQLSNSLHRMAPAQQ